MYLYNDNITFVVFCQQHSLYYVIIFLSNFQKGGITLQYYPLLRDLREDHDLTQTQLVERLGIHKTTYVNYEQGKREPPFELMIRLADFYHVSLDYIAGLTDQPVAPVNPSNRFAAQSIQILNSLSPSDQRLWLEQGKLLIKLHSEMESTQK